MAIKTVTTLVVFWYSKLPKNTISGSLFARETGGPTDRSMFFFAPNLGGKHSGQSSQSARRWTDGKYGQVGVARKGCGREQRASGRSCERMRYGQLDGVTTHGCGGRQEDVAAEVEGGGVVVATSRRSLQPI